MTCEIIIRPEAAVDIEHAFNWFEEKHQGLGVQCLTAVDACLTAIANMPFAYPVVYREVRRALTKKFPYCLFYVVRGDQIIVVACLHARRNPIEWMRRGEAVD